MRSLGVLFVVCVVLESLHEKSSAQMGMGTPMTDQGFYDHIERKSSFGIVMLGPHDANVENADPPSASVISLDRSSFGVGLGILNCGNSALELCRGSTSDMHIFKKGAHAGIVTYDEFQQEEQALDIHDFFKHDNLFYANNNQTWQLLKDMKRPIVLLVANNSESKMYEFAMELAGTVPRTVMVVFTLGSTEFVEHHPPKDGTYITTSIVLMRLDEHGRHQASWYNYLPLKDRVRTAVGKLVRDSFYSVAADQQAVDALVAASLEADNDVIVLETSASPKADEAVRRLAHAACFDVVDRCDCVVHTTRQHTNSTRKDEKIYMKLFSKLKNIDVGALIVRTSDEIVWHSKRLLTDRKIYVESSAARVDPIRGNKNATPRPPLVEFDDRDLLYEYSLEEHVSEHIHPVEEQNDDPVSFSVHTDPFMKKLYLRHKHELLPMLDDKKYAQVTDGKQTAVILFTMEFNQKSIAVLSHFYDFHKMLVEIGEADTVHHYRVECFDWPDVCEKAGVTTYPQLIYYREYPPQKPQVYAGAWFKPEMDLDMLFHMMPWPMTTYELGSGISGFLDHNLHFHVVTIYGNVATKTGVKAFRKFSQQMGRKHFIVMSINPEPFLTKRCGEVEKSRDVVSITRDDDCLRHNLPFSSPDDIAEILAEATKPPRVTELTELNYAEMTSSTNVSIVLGVYDATDTSSIQVFAELAEKSNNEVVYKWMISGPYTSGSYIFKVYCGGNPPKTPVACINKGSVSVASLRDVSEKWMADCARGTLDVTYTKEDRAWRGRVPGYDYLQMLKEYDVYPTPEDAMSIPQQLQEVMDRAQAERQADAATELPVTPELHAALDAAPVHTEL